jgi:polyadenylate-binding protein
MATTEPVATEVPAAEGSAPMTSPNASLYVGELDQSITEAILFELFNQVGPVDSIRVCRDAVTRRSLGYAYVNFHNITDCERALETLNYTEVRGRPIRIMWSQRDPSLRKSGAGNIFIKNLDPSIDNKALHDTFSAFGNILSCKVAMEDGVSKGYGFVHYENAESAEAAIKGVNGMLLNDKKVYVGHHIPKKERINKIEEQMKKYTNIYIKNLDESVDEKTLEKDFGKYGKITSCVVQRDENGKSRGFGFINFENSDEAHLAVESMHEKEYHGKQLYVSRAQKKNEREEELRKQYERLREEKLNKYQGVNLYIKNLDDSIDDEKLRQEFSPYGTITSAKVMRDEKTNVSKGFGFVCFSSPDEATKAVSEMNGRMLLSKPIYVALAQRKEVRKAHLEAQINQRTQLRNMQVAAAQVQSAPMFNSVPFMYPNNMQQNGRGGMYFQQQQMMNRRNWPNQQNQVPPFQPNNLRQPRQQPPRQPGNRPPQMPVSQPMPAPGQPMANPAMQNRRPGNFKYPQPNPRNGPMVPKPVGPSINANALLAMSPEDQKSALGEALYPLIQAQYPQYAGKITGMLLEMDKIELLNMLENPEALDIKVKEAITVLEEYKRKTEGDNE